MLSPAQCRAARGLLAWNQEDLAEQSRVSVVTIRNFENGKTTPYAGTLVLLRQAFETAGVELTNGNEPGVKLKATAVEDAKPAPKATSKPTKPAVRARKKS